MADDVEAEVRHHVAPRRIELAKAAGIPIVNYGLVLAKAGGLKVEDLLI